MGGVWGLQLSVPAPTSLKLELLACIKHPDSCVSSQPCEDSFVYGVVVTVIHFTDGKIEARG